MLTLLDIYKNYPTANMFNTNISLIFKRALMSGVTEMIEQNIGTVDITTNLDAASQVVYEFKQENGECIYITYVGFLRIGVYDQIKLIVKMGDDTDIFPIHVTTNINGIMSETSHSPEIEKLMSGFKTIVAPLLAGVINMWCDYNPSLDKPSTLSEIFNSDELLISNKKEKPKFGFI